MNTQQQLFAQFLREAPYQPATDWWRAIEIDHVIRRGLPPGRGLDLGCGDGELTGIVLAAVGRREMVGIDLDPAETSDAARSGIYSAVHTASAAAIPEPDAAFDFVFSNSVLEHIPDIDEVLSETARVLKPGGRFIFTVPGPGFHALLRGPAAGDRATYLRDVDQRCAHLRYWSVQEWTHRLGVHDLGVERVDAYLSATELQRWETLSNWTAGLLQKLVFGRTRPIEIQRSLGLRRSWLRLPRVVSVPLAAALSLGGSREDDQPIDETTAACLYVDCVKTANNEQPTQGQ